MLPSAAAPTRQRRPLPLSQDASSPPREAATFLRARERALNSPWCNSIVAPRTARRPAGKARRPRISGIFDGGATQPDGMHRRSNADGVAPRAANLAVSLLAAAAALFFAACRAPRADDWGAPLDSARRSY